MSLVVRTLENLNANVVDEVRQIFFASPCLRIIGFNPEFRTTMMHRYKSAVSRFEIILEMIESGYRFDDEKSPRYQHILREALKDLHETTALLTELFDSEVALGGDKP